jgi:uncharacterized protein
MTEKTSYKGRFVWYDLMTSDPTAAKKFYGTLFGWTAKEDEVGSAGTYTMFRNQSKEFGGLMEIGKDRPMPSYWIGYVAVEDIHAAAGRVPGAGGRVAHPPTEIPDVGHFAVIIDPQGAAFCLFQGREMEGADDWQIPCGPGTVAWNELMTTNPQAAAGFYKGICGWSSREEDMGSMGKYWIFRSGEKDVAGMMPIPPGSQGPPAWLSYFQVADVDQSTKKAQELGGKVFVQPTDIPNIGRFSVTADPTGAMLALFKSA